MRASSSTAAGAAPALETSWNGALAGQRRARHRDLGRRQRARSRETGDGGRLPAELPRRAGADRRLAGRVRRRAAERGEPCPYGEVHSNVLSLAMVEAAVRSAETGQRVALADVLDDAYAQAVRRSRTPESAPFWHPGRRCRTSSVCRAAARQTPAHSS